VGVATTTTAAAQTSYIYALERQRGIIWAWGHRIEM